MSNETSFNICCKQQYNVVCGVQKTDRLVLHCYVPVTVVKLPAENCSISTNKVPEIGPLSQKVADAYEEASVPLSLSLLDHDRNPIANSNDIVQIVKLKGLSKVRYAEYSIIVVQIKEAPSNHNATFYILRLTFTTFDTQYVGDIKIEFMNQDEKKKRKLAKTVESASVLVRDSITEEFPMETAPTQTIEEPPVLRLQNMVQPIVNQLSENLSKLDKDTQMVVVTSVENSIGEAQRKLLIERNFYPSRSMQPQ